MHMEPSIFWPFFWDKIKYMLSLLKKNQVSLEKVDFCNIPSLMLGVEQVAVGIGGYWTITVRLSNLQMLSHVLSHMWPFIEDIHGLPVTALYLPIERWLFNWHWAIDTLVHDCLACACLWADVVNVRPSLLSCLRQQACRWQYYCFWASLMVTHGCLLGIISFTMSTRTSQ